MHRPNVPLATLRVFESAARLQGFDKAAVELHVSASAVSQQIARLEDKLGLALFERQHRRIVLTEAGRDLAKPLTNAFRAIDRALAAAAQAASKQAIKIAIYQTWASRWLIPRLSNFSRDWPQVSVEFATGMEAVDFERSDVDFAVRWRTPLNAGRDACKLFDEALVAVCSPEIAAQLKNVSDLDGVTLIQSANRPDDWDTWLSESRHSLVQGTGSLKFSNTSLAIDAAVAGAGVLVGQIHLFLPEIESGALTMAFASIARTGRALYLLQAPSGNASLSSVAFKAWIMDEARRAQVRAESAVA